MRPLQLLLPGLAGLTALLSGFADHQWTWFDWHATCMLIAWIGIMGNAVLIKKRGGYENTKTHAWLMFLAVFIIMIGQYIR